MGGRIIFAAAVDFTIFGKRLNLRVNINLRNPAAAVKETSSNGVENYKVREWSMLINTMVLWPDREEGRGQGDEVA